MSQRLNENKFKQSMLALWFMLSLSALLSGCADAETKPSTSLPSVDYECSSYQAIGCDQTSQSKPAFAGLIRDINVGCREILSFLSSEQLTAQFDYSSWTQTENSSGAVAQGIFTHWVNHAHFSVLNITREKYKICSFIDLNENGRADVYEPLGEMQFTPGESFMPLSNWTNF